MTQTGSNGPVGTELAPRFVIHPATGEKLELNAPDVNLAVALDSIRTLEGQLKDVKSEINRELLARLDLAAKWSRKVSGGLGISSPSSELDEAWPEAQLREALLKFVDAGLLTVEAVDAAVEVNVEYKLKKAGVTALRKRGGAIRECIDALCVRTPKTRYVSVKRITS